ncbi:MAG: dihydrofolate reductase [Lachnospiraceae bacterium]|nr:dihydrofolate reductase [Lachnospiraceae bacterium]
MKIVASVDNNWAIGRRGELLISIPNDLKRFRELTIGKTIIYGRKTLSTFPQGLVLQGRRNIVMSAKPGFTVKGGEVANSLEELFKLIEKENTEDVFVVGGESIYKQLLPYCDECLLTMIDMEYEADAYFPRIDKSQEWEQVSESDEYTYFDVPYTFARYTRKA